MESSHVRISNKEIFARIVSGHQNLLIVYTVQLWVKNRHTQKFLADESDIIIGRFMALLYSGDGSSCHVDYMLNKHIDQGLFRRYNIHRGLSYFDMMVNPVLSHNGTK